MLGFGVERGRVVLDDAHLLLAFGVLHRGHRLPGELLYAVQRVPVDPAAGMMDEDLAQRAVALARLVEIRVTHARILREQMLRCNRVSTGRRSRAHYSASTSYDNFYVAAWRERLRSSRRAKFSSERSCMSARASQPLRIRFLSCAVLRSSSFFSATRCMPVSCMEPPPLSLLSVACRLKGSSRP